MPFTAGTAKTLDAIAPSKQSKKLPPSPPILPLITVSITPPTLSRLLLALIISFSSDWLFPSVQSKELVNALMRNKKDVSYCEIQSPCGHDAFLLEFEKQTKIIKSFLRG